MKLSDYVINFLAENNIKHIFHVIGGTTTHLVESTYNRKDIQCIVNHHEQGSAFAAEGYARINGIGVAMATSGAGAVNLLAGVASAYFDSVPVIFITGQVNTYDFKGDIPIRQMGFQEMDIVSMAKPISKYATMISDPKMIKYELQKAIYIAQSGRPGSVLLDIPMNVQRVDINPDELEEYKPIYESKYIEKYKINTIVKLIEETKSPLILVGGGVRSSGACDLLYEFVMKTQIPVVSSLLGLDSFPHDDHLYVGMIGAYGNRYANLAIQKCDLLIVLGSRLDGRQTGTKLESFTKNAKIIHVDIDETELGSKIQPFIAIKSDIKYFLDEIYRKVKANRDNHLKNWYYWIESMKDRYPSSIKKLDSINPNYFMEYLSSIVEEDAIICLDVGQHQMWAAQSFELKKNQRMLISGGLGSMGYGLPAAIGASFANPGKQVIAILGDGGFQMNIQELQTIVRNKLPIKIFVINNNCLGMVKQFQELYFNKHTLSTVEGYNNPDFVNVLRAYRITSIDIENFEEMKCLIPFYLKNKTPTFFNIIISQQENVDPKLEYDHPLEDMSPYLDREELKQIMESNCG